MAKEGGGDGADMARVLMIVTLVRSVTMILCGGRTWINVAMVGCFISV